jgi:hypothetical protein
MIEDAPKQTWSATLAGWGRVALAITGMLVAAYAAGFGIASTDRPITALSGMVR